MSITRRQFSAALSASGAAMAAQTAATPNAFYGEIVAANDAAASALLSGSAPQNRRGGIRQVGEQIEVLSASFCCPESSLSRSEKLIAPLEALAATLLRAQHSDGTIDAGNLNSPPDTGFVVETTGRALAVLRKTDDARLTKTRDALGQFLVRAGEPLATGGVHTPNHRWVISSGLARIHSLFPAQKYVDRIDDWLGEGVFTDADGQYPERSTGIYSRVENNAFITMARLLQRPTLLEPVRKNLDMTVYYAHPDGELETVGSRRQDQNMTGYLSTYYLEYRYMAMHDRNPSWAAVVRAIEDAGGARVKRTNPLISFLEEPLLRNPLPPGGSMPGSFARVFPGTALARIRREAVSATVYGGSDWPLGVASGLASNPSFFSFRKGKAVLESVRMGANFFSEGAFRSDGLIADGNRYTLHQRFDVPYYLPLPKDKRNPRGDYPLTPAADARFWSKLNFPARPVSHVQTLDQKVTIVENNGVFELQFDISGHDRVPFTIELGFRPGGSFEGAMQERSKGVYLLKEGTGKYRVGNDVVEFGPGEAAHEFLDLSGSSYTAHGARLKVNADCVYITGFTPFRRTFTIRASAQV